jgi:hypothetical protein
LAIAASGSLAIEGSQVELIPGLLLQDLGVVWLWGRYQQLMTLMLEI